MPGKRKMPKGVPFAKGDPRINRAGRPLGFSRAIREVCGNDPTELARIGLDIARGKLSIDVVRPMKLPTGPNSARIVNHRLKEVPNHTQRLEALEFLRDTGWGKPLQQIEISEVEQEAIEFEKLSRLEQAKQLRAAAKALLAEAAAEDE